MRCPKCGNEVSQDEAFCGQCGTPTSPPAHPTEMVYTPPQRSGLLNSYNPNNTNNPNPPSIPPLPPNAYSTGMLPPPQTYNPNPAGAITPNQPTIRPTNPQQQSGFYQDATEAISVVPGSNGQAFPTGYPQQGFTGTPMQGGYPGTGQYAPPVQPFQAGNYTQHGFSQAPQFPGSQGYGYGVQPGLTPPPKKQQTHAGLVIASVCLAVALIAAIVFGAIYLTQRHSSPDTSVTPTPVATTAPSPTAVPSPTPSPTATATPTPTPSPTATPTAAPDAGFSWCTSQCTSEGFIVEYPNGWNQGQTSDKTGVEFLNPAQQDQYAAFKAPVAQANSNASTLVDNDLQSGFSAQPGYVAPTSKSVTTIGGETWTYAIAYYQLNNQKERVEVFATIHSGKGYVIELQAADSQFDAVNSQYFATMIGRFQFQQSTS